MKLHLDQERWEDEEIACLGFERATVYVPGQAAEDAKQRTDDNDTPLWDISCSLKDGRQTTNFKVRIASTTPPDIDRIDRIHFGGFQASSYPDGPRNVLSFSADTFVLGGPPSVTRKTTPPPAPDAKKAA